LAGRGVERADEEGKAGGREPQRLDLFGLALHRTAYQKNCGDHNQ